MSTKSEPTNSTNSKPTRKSTRAPKEPTPVSTDPLESEEALAQPVVAGDPARVGGSEFSFSIPLHVDKLDKTAAVGKLMAEAGRFMGNRITTEVMQSRGDWDIDITISMRKAPNS